MGNKSRHSNSRNVVFRIPEQRIWKNLGSRVPYVFFLRMCKNLQNPLYFNLERVWANFGSPVWFFFWKCFVEFLKEFGSVHSLRFFLKNVKECGGGGLMWKNLGVILMLKNLRDLLCFGSLGVFRRMQKNLRIPIYFVLEGVCKNLRSL